jgi:rod shape-determining protein MreD
LEATILPHLQVGSAQPDLTMLVVGAWSLRRGVEEGAVWAFIGGIFLDLLSAGPVSATMFALLTVSLILGVDPSTGVGRRQTRPFGGNPMVLILGVVFATLSYHLILLTVLQLVGRPLDWFRAGTDIIAPHTLFNLVLVPAVYRLMAWIDNRSRPEEFVM